MHKADPDKDKKTVLIAWSGGVDSTALVCHYLTQGWAVKTIHCQILNNETKVAREAQARQKMIEAYFCRYNFQDYAVNKTEMGTMGRMMNFDQLPSWIFSLITTVGSHHDEVALGYVMNDDAVSYVEDIKALWNAYRPFVSGELPPLVFPFLKTKKVNLYRSLPPELMPLVTWCENTGEQDMCGDCSPCKRMVDLGFQNLITAPQPAPPRRLRKLTSSSKK